MSILIASLGVTIESIIEVLGFINADTLGFYKNHPNFQAIQHIQRTHFKKKEVQEIWLYSTNQANVQSYKDKLDYFCQKNQQKMITRLYILPFADIDTTEHANMAKEFALRLLYKAQATQEPVFISLTGGRKTMASDLYFAGTLFGCDGFIHILSKKDQNSDITFHDKKADSIPASEIQYFTPLLYGQTKGDSAIKTIEVGNPLFSLGEIKNKHIILIEEQDLATCGLQKEVEQRLQKAANLLINNTDKYIFYNFPILQSCSAELFGQLKETRVASIHHVKKLPKIDLHCHLGGCLSVSDIVSIAEQVLVHEYPYERCFSLEEAQKHIIKAKANISYFKNLDYKTKIKVLAAFRRDAEVLDELWYEPLLNEKNFFNVNFDIYEYLGDLQGSGLLQTKTAIRLAVATLLQRCKEDGCIGLEIRCSPQNYTKEGLTYNQVLFEILDEINTKRGDLEVSIILIASRHRKMSEIYSTIELYSALTQEASKVRELFEMYFKGFDVAGAEGARRPSEIRSAFIDVLKDCKPITIHAGETQEAEHIWEAVYELNADRIGHGLSLNKNEALLVKFREKGIGVELCPSSNFQIVGFNDYNVGITDTKLYPLSAYLHQGLKVTVNTDNRGISRTTLSHEFLKASHMTESGLSLLDALQLCKNSIDVSFFDHGTKEKLYDKAHTILQSWLEDLFH